MQADPGLYSDLHDFMTRRDVGESNFGNDRRMIYRNNYFFALTEVLSSLYPVVRKLVGNEFFGAMAREFILTAPPQHPVLAEYGEGFSAFLKDFPPVAELPYLADTARLEWALQVATLAADASLLDLNALLLKDSEQLPGMTLDFLPSALLVSATYPVLEIWEANQDGSEASLTLEQKETGVFVWRPGLSVQSVYFDLGQTAFLRALISGGTIESAYISAAAEDAAFDLSGIIQRLALMDCLTAPAGISAL